MQNTKMPFIHLMVLIGTLAIPALIYAAELFDDPKNATNWVIIAGKWEINGATVRYSGPDDDKSATPFGIILNKQRLWNGQIETTVRFTNKLGAAHILFSYNPISKNHYTIGLGGGGYSTLRGVQPRYCGDNECGFVLGEFLKNLPYSYSQYGWNTKDIFGRQSSLFPNVDYKIVLLLEGNYFSMAVNNIEVLFSASLLDLQSDYVGLLAWGTEPIEFKDFKVSAKDILK